MTPPKQSIYLPAVAGLSISFGILGLGLSLFVVFFASRLTNPSLFKTQDVLAAVSSAAVHVAAMVAGIGLVTLRTWSFTLARIVWVLYLLGAILVMLWSRVLAPYAIILLLLSLAISGYLIFYMNRSIFAATVLHGWNIYYHRSRRINSTFSTAGVELPLDDPTIQLELAARLINEGKLSRAIPVVRSLVNNYPNNPDVVYIASRLQTDMVKKRSPSEKGATFAPDHQDDPTVQLRMVVQFVNEGKRSEAAHILQNLVKKHPNNPDVWYLVGFLQTDLAKKQNAYEKTLALDPNHQAAKKALADLKKI